MFGEGPFSPERSIILLINVAIADSHTLASGRIQKILSDIIRIWYPVVSLLLDLFIIIKVYK